MIIDLHVHTANHSKCAVSDADAVMTAALDRGLDAVVLTEHGFIWPESEFAALRSRFPQLSIFRGIEVSTPEGEDLLIYGVSDPAAFDGRPPAETVIARAKSQGAAVVLAHAFRYRDTIADALYQSPPDACEAWSHNIFSYQRPMIREYAVSVGCGLLAASDSHCAANIGVFAIRLDQPARDEAELAKALRGGAYSALIDHPRLVEIDAVLKDRATQAAAGIAAGLDTPTIRKSIGGSLSFIDHIRSGRTPQMLDPKDTATHTAPGLQPVNQPI